MGLLYVFNVTAFIPAFYPSANVIAWALTGLLVTLPFAGMYTLMAISMPRTGGDYVWASRIIHPSIGFISNFVITVMSLSLVGSVAPQAVQWAAAHTFYDLGKIYGNQQYLDIATALQGQDVAFWASVILVIIAGLVVIASVKLATRTVVFWTFVSFIIGALFVITVLSAGTSTFISSFNTLSGSSYEGVIAAGQQAGAYQGVPPVLSMATLYGGLFGTIGYWGFFYPVYFAGEVKEVRRGQIVGQIGAVLVYSAFYAIITAVMYFGMGPDFANSLAVLWATGSGQYPYIGAPLTSGLSMFWTQNVLLIVLFTLSYAVNIEVMNISILFTFARNLFAWSFDRIVPTRFADVNSKTHTPVKATIIMVLVSLFFVYVAVYQFGIVAATYSYGTVGLFTAFAIISIAAMIYPFRRRDLFEISHPAAKIKIAGMPVVSLLGAISFVVSLAVVYAILQPAALNLETILLTGVIPTWIAAIVIYAVSWAIRRSQGIDLSLTMKEVPPL